VTREWSKLHSAELNDLYSTYIKQYGEVNSVKNTTINIWLNDGVY